MAFRSLIFDLDGTLVDSAAGIEASLQQALHECRPERQISNVAEQIGPPVPVMLRRLCPDLPEPEIERLVAAFRRHYDRDGWRRSVLYPAVAETLNDLEKAELEMFVLTNKPAHATRAILEANGIARYFRDIRSPDGPGVSFSRKAEGALRLRSEHGLDGATTAVIGDGRDDAEAAATCGFAFVFARYGYRNSEVADSSGGSTSIGAFRELLSLTRNSLAS